MSDVVTQDGEAGLGVGAVELLVDVLSQSQSSRPTGAAPTDFYDRLCEAVCRLARMRRAVIFQYDAGKIVDVPVEDFPEAKKSYLPPMPKTRPRSISTHLQAAHCSSASNRPAPALCR